MTRRPARPVTPAAPSPPPPPPTAEELLAELRRTATRREAQCAEDAARQRANLAALRPEEAAGSAWTYAALVRAEERASVWREVLSLLYA
ncbi:MAG TPA: hypothetical protein VFV33_14270 [Gemmatimonadaceae bacterium]|nr:hypothetical protein [Gemmatimonadaceae bacterium]